MRKRSHVQEGALSCFRKTYQGVHGAWAFVRHRADGAVSVQAVRGLAQRNVQSDNFCILVSYHEICCGLCGTHLGIA